MYMCMYVHVCSLRVRACVCVCVHVRARACLLHRSLTSPEVRQSDDTERMPHPQPRSSEARSGLLFERGFVGAGTPKTRQQASASDHRPGARPQPARRGGSAREGVCCAVSKKRIRAGAAGRGRRATTSSRRPHRSICQGRNRARRKRSETCHYREIR